MTADAPTVGKAKGMENEKMKIAYERLSRDDEQQGESNSIKNQKKLLEDYATKSGFSGLVHLTDDGYSGTRWDRPAITKLIDEVDAGNVGIVLVKDMSRLGRDHLRVGLLLEKFRERSVRFIAVNDNVDTDNGMDDFTPFRNIMNEWVARDTSRKIRAVNEARIKDGKHVTGAIIYGYLRGNENGGAWVVDEEAAVMVRRMFRSVIEGMGVTQIAEMFTAEGVLIPSAHWEKINAGMRKHPNAHPTRWAVATVINLLRKPEYMGWAVFNKSVKETYKSKRRAASKDEWIVFKDAHPQIIDEETWHVVQRLRDTKRHIQGNGGANPLTGVLYCADCGHKMHHKTGTSNNVNIPHDEYVCSSYRHYSRSCTYHYIRAVVVEELILSAIRRVSRYVRENEAEFVKRVREDSVLRQEAAVKENRKKLAKAKRRRDEIGALIKKLYESFAKDMIPENHFSELLNGYDSEQRTLDGEIARLMSEVDRYNADTMKAAKFIAIVKRHTDITAFSATLLNEFVEKVIVHEADKSSGKRTQKVDIYMNFIGMFDVPEDETEQPAEEVKSKRRPRTDKDREYDRRKYAKVRDARIAAEQKKRAEILKGTSYEEIAEIPTVNKAG
jgi:DNA invertase Pin-like site-specific DNA recombinase